MYQVLLRNNETKQQKLVSVDTDWHDSAEFLWTEGNYSCDCNRHLFFTDWDGTHCECGEDKYTAVHAILDDGSIIPLDED